MSKALRISLTDSRDVSCSEGQLKLGISFLHSQALDQIPLYGREMCCQLGMLQACLQRVPKMRAV